MPAEFNRAQRLGERIKRDLALLIQRELKDPRIGMVTVNFVQLSRDLSYADVNVTCLLYTSPSPRDRTRSRMPSSA